MSLRPAAADASSYFAGLSHFHQMANRVREIAFGNSRNFGERSAVLPRNSAGGRLNPRNRQFGAVRHFGWIRHRGNIPQRLVPVAQDVGETVDFAGVTARGRTEHRPAKCLTGICDPLILDGNAHVWSPGTYAPRN
jgi:hypothetical protein